MTDKLDPVEIARQLTQLLDHQDAEFKRQFPNEHAQYAEAEREIKAMQQAFVSAVLAQDLEEAQDHANRLARRFPAAVKAYRIALNQRIECEQKMGPLSPAGFVMRPPPKDHS